MSFYINKGNDSFSGARRGVYVDKSGMISVINSTLETERRFSCVTRPRRFGKSMAAEMLCAYYDQSCDSHTLFDDLAIAKSSSYADFLNKYPVIYVDITNFTTQYRDNIDLVTKINSDIKSDIVAHYPNIEICEGMDLMDTLAIVSKHTSKKIIMIVDEWDAVLREFAGNDKVVDDYINFLRRLFKGGDSKSIFAGVYMTGILPIKKYKTESALNNFREYSMVSPGPLAPYFGFTSSEVLALCEKYNVEYDDMVSWYDGYKVGNVTSIFNPYSVTEALANSTFRNYWSNTGTYESIKTYIQMNFDGLKDDLIEMLAGCRCNVNVVKFQNDMNVISCKDDIFTVLIHLGYLAYDMEDGCCYIPNREILEVFVDAITDSSWVRLSSALATSKKLLEATVAGDEESVCRGIDLVHDENTSILSYNDENSLSCVLSIAYYYARKDYIFHHESGNGFADLVLIPRKGIVAPALVIELKYDTAIDQKVAEYSNNLILVGISYNKADKKHTCKIKKTS